MIDPERLAQVKAMLKPQADLLEHFEGANLPKEQTEISTTVTIPFYGDKLIAIAVDGEYMVPVKPIAERLGLDWDAQRKRIQRDYTLNEGAVMMTAPSDGGLQETLCLPLKYLPGWLFGVDDDRVSPDIQWTIRTYKREMYDVMHNYLTNGVAINPRMMQSTPKHVQSGVGTREYGNLNMRRLALSVICEAVDLLDNDAKFDALYKMTKILKEIYPEGLHEDYAEPKDKLELLRLVMCTGYQMDVIRTQSLCRMDEARARNLIYQMKQRFLIVPHPGEGVKVYELIGTK